MRLFGRLFEIVDVNDLSPTVRRQVEKLDYFSDPAYVGKAIPFACPTEGDRFYQSGTVPVFEILERLRPQFFGGCVCTPSIVQKNFLNGFDSGHTWSNVSPSYRTPPFIT